MFEKLVLLDTTLSDDTVLETEMRVGKCFEIAAAHSLPGYEGKCGEIHGHTWRIEIEIEGEVRVGTCMVIDFKCLKEIVAPIIETLDHSYLNDFIANPTAEAIATWIAMNIQESIEREGVRLISVTVWERETSWAKFLLEPSPARLRFPKPGEFPI